MLYNGLIVLYYTKIFMQKSGMSFNKNTHSGERSAIEMERKNIQYIFIETL